MVDILIRCPTCSIQDRISIEEESVKDVKRGLLAVNIEKDMICGHSFIVYIDKNLHVRNYFVADFQISVPEKAQELDINVNAETLSNLIDVALLKMKITPTSLTYIIRAIFFKKKIVLIIEEDFLKWHIDNFFKFITKNSFDVDISIILDVNYQDKNREYNNYVIIRNNEIIKDDDNIINPKHLKFEKRIIEKFYEENDAMSSLIILKNEIFRVFDDSINIGDLIKNILKLINIEEDVNRSEIITSKKTIDYIRKVKKVKKSVNELEYILEMIKNDY